MKGQQEVISVILISGILISVVGSVYMWGVPLIQKNKDISILESSENFMRNLDSRIRFVSNNGGRDIIRIPNGLLSFNSATGELTLIVESKGTIYATEAEIPLGKNSCARSTGVLGTDEPASLCVKSSQLSAEKYRTIYTLRYIILQSPETLRDFRIRLTGNPGSGGGDRSIVFENRGTLSSESGGRTLTSNNINIDFV